MGWQGRAGRRTPSRADAVCGLFVCGRRALRKPGLHFHMWCIIGCLLPGGAVLAVADSFERDLKARKSALDAAKQALEKRVLADPHGDFSATFKELGIKAPQQEELLGRSILAKLRAIESRLAEVEAAEARKREALLIAPRLYNLLMQGDGSGPVPLPVASRGGPVPVAVPVPAPSPAAATPAAAVPVLPPALAPASAAHPPAGQTAAHPPAGQTGGEVGSTRSFVDRWVVGAFSRAARALGTAER